VHIAYGVLDSKKLQDLQLKIQLEHSRHYQKENWVEEQVVGAK